VFDSCGSSSWHDGPVAGLAEYDGNEYWYSVDFDEATEDFASPRLYKLRRLSAIERAEEWHRHRLFESYVSTKHCHHDDVQEPVVRPREMWHLFYDDPENRSRNEDRHADVVGVFRLPGR
jgi:hypothetical protein